PALSWTRVGWAEFKQKRSQVNGRSMGWWPPSESNYQCLQQQDRSPRITNVNEERKSLVGYRDDKMSGALHLFHRDNPNRFSLNGHGPREQSAAEAAGR